MFFLSLSISSCVHVYIYICYIPSQRRIVAAQQYAGGHACTLQLAGHTVAAGEVPSRGHRGISPWSVFDVFGCNRFVLIDAESGG